MMLKSLTCLYRTLQLIFSWSQRRIISMEDLVHRKGELCVFFINGQKAGRQSAVMRWNVRFPYPSHLSPARSGLFHFCKPLGTLPLTESGALANENRLYSIPGFQIVEAKKNERSDEMNSSEENQEGNDNRLIESASAVVRQKQR